MISEKEAEDAIKIVSATDATELLYQMVICFIIWKQCANNNVQAYEYKIMSDPETGQLEILIVKVDDEKEDLISDYL